MTNILAIAEGITTFRQVEEKLGLTLNKDQSFFIQLKHFEILSWLIQSQHLFASPFRFPQTVLLKRATDNSTPTASFTKRWESLPMPTAISLPSVVPIINRSVAGKPTLNPWGTNVSWYGSWYHSAQTGRESFANCRGNLSQPLWAFLSAIALYSVPQPWHSALLYGKWLVWSLLICKRNLLLQNCWFSSNSA